MLLASSVARSDSLNESAEPHVADLHRQVDVICHPTIGVHTHVVATQRSCEQIFERVIVGLMIEDGLLVVAAEDDVIQPSGNVQTWAARHHRSEQCKEVP